MYGILCAVGYLAIKGSVTPDGLILVVIGIQRMIIPMLKQWI